MKIPMSEREEGWYLAMVEGEWTCVYHVRKGRTLTLVNDARLVTPKVWGHKIEMPPEPPTIVEAWHSLLDEAALLVGPAEALDGAIRAVGAAIERGVIR